MQFIPCRRCRNGWIINKESDEIIKCDCLKKYQIKANSEILFKDSNLPYSLKSFCIDSYIGEDKNKNLDKLQKYINNFEKKFLNVHLYIYGKNSTQKTTVLSWVGKELIQKGISVYYILMNELIKSLTQEGYEESISLFVDELYNKNVLIIDESFDRNKLTLYKSNYQIPFLDEFLRKRLEIYKKSTIFISNIFIDDIDPNFGRSIKELIIRNCSSSILKFEDNINIQNNFNTEDLWK